MTEPGGTIHDGHWEVERIAERYEMALRRGDSENSIEQLLSQHAGVPQEALLLALIEAELDVYGESGDAKQSYLQRFPKYAKSIELLFGGPYVPSALPLAPGDRLGDYVVVRLIGRGAIGLVYLAEDSSKRKQVAIKILRPDWERAWGDDYRDLFRKEAVLTRPLEHPRIVKLLDSGEYGDLPYHVFEYIAGPTLADFSGTRTMDSVKAASLIADVADAIQYSHRRGVVHRDLKPTNILIDQHGRAHVTDFGIALEHSELGTGSSFIGTPLYMSPEQVGGSSHHLDGRSDVFSLGVILYQMTTGVHPFLPPNASQHTLTHSIATIPAPPLRQRADVPKEFDQICMKALAKDPMDRFNTAGDFAIALHDYARRGTRKRVWALSVCAALALVGGLGFLWIRGQPRSSPASMAEVSSDSMSEGTPTEAFSGLPAAVVSQADLASMDQSVAALLPEGVERATPQDIELAAAMIVARLKAGGNVPSAVWEHFGAGRDNTLQTALIHMCAIARVDPQRLIERAYVEHRTDVCIGLLLALGEYTDQQLPPSARSGVVDRLRGWYAFHPQAAMHSACGWLLRRWDEDTEALSLQQQLGFPTPSEQRQWFEILPNIAMIACYPSRATASLPPEGQAGRLPQTDFAISALEVTTAQWDWVMGDPRSMSHSAAALPKMELSWHQCAEFCNRLSEIMGLPDDEKCYEELPNHNFRVVADAELRRGFRMPTLAEWEFAARGGTTTDRYWGRNDSYLIKYANCRPHSFLKPIAGGSLKPNGLGLFDMLGNATEWIHDTAEAAERLSGSSAERSIRGGSAWTLGSGVNVEAEYTMAADLPSERMGLRIVQSLLEADVEAAGLTVELQMSRVRGGEATGLPVPVESLRLAVAKSQKLGEKQFLGRFQRGISLPRTLVVTNHARQPLTLSGALGSGCLQLLDQVEVPRRLLPQESVELRASLASAGTMLQAGEVTIHATADDGTREDFNCPVFGYFSGPSITALEGAWDSQGVIRFDFGRVQPGTMVRQLATLVNVGDQLLSLEASESAGAIRLSDSSATHRLTHQAQAFIEFEFRPLSEGRHVGQLNFETNDPAHRQVRLEAIVEAVELPLVPVFCVYRQGLWSLDYDRDGRPDRTIEFGELGDRPFVADLDRDGVHELGVYRRIDDDRVVLRTRTESAAGRVGESTRFLQVGQGTLVVGDFNGNGYSDLAWASAGQSGFLNWQIDYGGDGSWDRSEEFGLAGDVPVAGDWFGKGRDGLGVYRPQASPGTVSQWHLRGHEDFPEPISATFGLLGDQPLVGDWNGDGKTDIGVFRIVDGMGVFLLDVNLDFRSESFVRFSVEGDVGFTFMAAPLR